MSAAVTWKFCEMPMRPLTLMMYPSTVIVSAGVGLTMTPAP